MNQTNSDIFEDSHNDYVNLRHLSLSESLILKKSECVSAEFIIPIWTQVYSEFSYVQVEHNLHMSEVVPQRKVNVHLN